MRVPTGIILLLLCTTAAASSDQAWREAERRGDAACRQALQARSIGPVRRAAPSWWLDGGVMLFYRAATRRYRCRYDAVHDRVVRIERMARRIDPLFSRSTHVG